ncbi:MAG: hydroxysqualene dehydroxylase HpnE [Planctomycetota bacterium]|nr:hydroxysqualene dehydroxylase HpnE [Planctomycetota bacterium]
MMSDVLIIGGGLAGLASAVRLAESGHRPVILETRRKLGGRATSFEDPRSGVVLDNCQHVLMGCCTNLQDLYQRLGVLDAIEWHDTLYWLREDGMLDVLTPGRLPGPLHQARSLRRMRLLDRAEKREVRRACWRLLRMGRPGRMDWRERTFAEFLASTNQSPRVCTLFWEPIIISACNLPPGRVAAVHAIQVFQDAFLPSRFAGMMGLPSVPLRELYDPAEDIITKAGGRIETGCSVRSIAFDDDGVRGVVTADGPLEAKLVLSTVPPDRLDKLVPDHARTGDSRLQNLHRFQCSPILGVHLLLDSPVLAIPHLVLPGRAVQWVFNKGVDEHGQQHLHAVISAADDWMDLDEEAIVERVLEDLSAAAPSIRDRTIVNARSVKERQATFAATPEIEPFRPMSAPSTIGVHGGDARGLYLAGDWCATGWPATMEGAVRSGYIAAEAITGSRCLVEDLPPSWLSGLLSAR